VAPTSHITADGDAQSRIAALEAVLAAERAQLSAQSAELQEVKAQAERLKRENDKLRQAYMQQREELELLRRRIFIAKAERFDTRQLELEFAKKLVELEALHGEWFDADKDAEGVEDIDSPPAHGNGNQPNRGKKKPLGRRDLSNVNWPERRCELTDPVLEELVAQGKATRVGAELSYKIGWQRGTPIKVVIARATYRTESSDGSCAFDKAEKPTHTFERSLAAPSLLAHVAAAKLDLGLPLFRLERELSKCGVKIDRGTMSRWLEDAGATVGATIIEAARKEALATAFCIATDATGISVLPPQSNTKERQPCKRGHFFIQIADRDHVFFEYRDKETSAEVADMFRGFTGYVQADAKSVFDVLYKPPPDQDADDDNAAVMKEVGCFAHCRRKFWEAAVALKSPLAREALYRIARIYDLERSWRGKPHQEIKKLRDTFLRPEIKAFFSWVDDCYEIEKSRRGSLRRAFGYAHRQQAALMRFLDDGRLCIDNNASERGLRQIAIGRKAWLFVGSDDHGTAAGHLLSLIASARLHSLDPEAYLRDIFRVLGHWPRHRYIELAPKYWAQTRARLDQVQLVTEFGPLDVPAALLPSEQQVSSR